MSRSRRTTETAAGSILPPSPRPPRTTRCPAKGSRGGGFKSVSMVTRTKARILARPIWLRPVGISPEMPSQTPLDATANPQTKPFSGKTNPIGSQSKTATQHPITQALNCWLYTPENLASFCNFNVWGPCPVLRWRERPCLRAGQLQCVSSFRVRRLVRRFAVGEERPPRAVFPRVLS